MLSEIISVLILMIVTVAVISFMIFLIVEDTVYFSGSQYENSLQKEVHMILEGDFFVRRISPVRRATSLNKDKHIIGFWESTENVRKYVFYHLELEKGKESIRFLNRYVISRSEIEASYYKPAIMNFIESVEKGIYCKPLNFFKPNNNISGMIRGARFYIEDDIYIVDSGVNKYYLP